MSDVAWGRRVLGWLVAASAIGLGIAVAMVDHSEGHRVPFIPGKFGWIIWIVAEFFFHPLIRIPLLSLLVFGAAYAWKRWYDKKRPDPAPPSAPEQITKVRCHACRRVQAVPVDRSTFVCEQCNTRLKRRTGDLAAHRPAG